jgi:hypothetical protein
MRQALIYRTPDQMREALMRGANGLFDARGKGGFRTAWEGLGAVLRDPTGRSGEGYYQDKELKKLYDRMYEFDHQIGTMAKDMEHVARTRFGKKSSGG